MSLNPLNIGLIAVAFAAGCYMAYCEQGFTSDLPIAVAMSIGVVGALTWAYLRFFRALNVVRIFVTPYGLIYRDGSKVLRVPRHALVSIERMPTGILGRWRVETARGTFQFDTRLVSANHLSRLIETWLATAKWDIGTR